MDDEQFLLNIWKYVIIGVCVVVVSGVGSCANYRYQLRKMAEAKIDPVLAACALDRGSSSSESADCILAIQSGK
jgi:hypothetical protein